jgi:UMF1 family MFS transporter
MFRNVPEVHSNKTYEGNILNKGFEELKKVWLQVKEQPTMLKYLLGFFFTSMGVQTVMYVASLFGEEELHLDTGVLIGTILVIQLIAILGAWAFSLISAAIGNIYTLIITIVIWMIICFLAYSIRDTPEYFTVGGVQVKKVVIHFMGLGVLVGMVMGGIQSLSRSTYSKFLPKTTDNTSYFSFYDVCEKLSIVFGMLTFGLITQVSATMRTPILALIVFFVTGFVLLIMVPKEKAE